MMDRQALIDALRATDAVQYGEFELSHGGTSEYYVDKYLFETQPGCIAQIADAFAERIGDELLAGVALGAVPLVAVTSVRTGNPYVIVRKQQKDYGTSNRIEGRYESGQTVVVLEDVATTGRSALSAVSALREAGLLVSRVLVVIDREEGARSLLESHNIELDALLTANDLLDDR